MPSTPVHWPDHVHEIITGDLTAAAAYITPAGGAVATGVAPCGIARRDDGVVGYTTSLAFAKKLERILREPRVALAFHARDHGFSDHDGFVLVQGRATVDLNPSQERLDALVPQAARYVGEVKRGPLWDRLLKQYYQERVFVDIAVERVVAWPDLGALGTPEVFGDARPGPPPPQATPKLGPGPRLDVDRAAGQVGMLPHRVLAFRGTDGFPVVVPVHLAGHDGQGLHLVEAAGQLPSGGRRAGLLAHAYQPQLVGLRTRTFTGWLDVQDGSPAVYAPHTSKGFSAPAHKELLLVGNGLLAKFQLRQARRRGVPATLERLAAEHRYDAV
jgi:hypothetical protein